MPIYIFSQSHPFPLRWSESSGFHWTWAKWFHFLGDHMHGLSLGLSLVLRLLISSPNFPLLRMIHQQILAEGIGLFIELNMWFSYFYALHSRTHDLPINSSSGESFSLYLSRAYVMCRVLAEKFGRFSTHSIPADLRDMIDRVKAWKRRRRTLLLALFAFTVALLWEHFRLRHLRLIR